MSEALQRALEDVLLVRTDPDVPGVTKRDIRLPIVDRVICHKEGVEVIFVPGLFDAELAGDEDGELIDYTTCMVCQVRGLDCSLFLQAQSV